EGGGDAGKRLEGTPGVRNQDGGGDVLDRGTVRAKVVAIYEEHNRDKLHTVDDTLDKYEGKWAVMLQRLEEKYVSATGLPPASGNGPLWAGRPWGGWCSGSSPTRPPRLRRTSARSARGRKDAGFVTKEAPSTGSSPVSWYREATSRGGTAVGESPSTGTSSRTSRSCGTTSWDC
ncbi:unnamed protein product, partial [Ectocarpus sp. 13 AM-2016]